MKNNTLLVVFATAAVMLCSCGSKGNETSKNDLESHSDNFVRQYRSDTNNEQNSEKTDENESVYIPDIVDAPDNNPDVAKQKMLDELNNNATIIKSLCTDAIEDAKKQKKTSLLDKYKTEQTIKIGEDSSDIIQHTIYEKGGLYLLNAGEAKIKLKNDYTVEYVYFRANYVTDTTIYGKSS